MKQDEHVTFPFPNFLVIGENKYDIGYSNYTHGSWFSGPLGKTECCGAASIYCFNLNSVLLLTILGNVPASILYVECNYPTWNGDTGDTTLQVNKVLKNHGASISITKQWDGYLILVDITNPEDYHTWRLG